MTRHSYRVAYATFRRSTRDLTQFDGNGMLSEGRHESVRILGQDVVFFRAYGQQVDVRRPGHGADGHPAIATWLISEMGRQGAAMHRTALAAARAVAQGKRVPIPG